MANDDLKYPLVSTDDNIILTKDNDYENKSCYGYSRTIVDSPYWNIFLLALAWALTLTTSTLLTSVGPLTATEELGASGKLMLMMMTTTMMMMMRMMIHMI